jgi:Uma2 family endonuclease
MAREESYAHHARLRPQEQLENGCPQQELCAGTPEILLAGTSSPAYHSPMSLDTLMDPILHSPQLAEISQRILHKLDAEHRMRVQFYADMTPEQKVEFIDGEIIMHSPARNVHLDVTGWIFVLLHSYVAQQRLGSVKAEKCLCVFPRNDYEPDIVFFGQEKSAALNTDTMKFPIPDLAVEVLSESTAARDRGVKFEDFEAHGVKEYWIVDAEAQFVEQYINQGDTFELTMKSHTGDLRSTAVPGLVLPVSAFFSAEANLAALRGMIRS